MTAAVRRFWLGLAASFASAIALAAPALADIAAFNAAVKAGDYRAASVAAAQTWPMLDKAAPDIAIVAREFAWASMLAGDPRSAQTYSGFLVDTPPATAPKGYLPVVAKVLDAWADFAVSSTRETRAALNNALVERATIDAKDLISVRAVQALFYDNWDKSRWREAAAAAWSGAAILRDYDKGLADTGYNLEMGAIAAEFAEKPAAELASQMRALAERSLADALATTEPLLKERLASVFFNVNAWAEVTERIMMQEDRRFQPAAKSDAMRQSLKLLSPAPGDAALPECNIVREDAARAPRFPQTGLFRGWPGFTTYRLTIAPGGGFREARVMGTAPDTGFAQSVDEAMQESRWTFRDSVRPPACRMPEYYYVEFEFRLGS